MMEQGFGTSPLPLRLVSYMGIIMATRVGSLILTMEIVAPHGAVSRKSVVEDEATALSWKELSD